MKTLETQEFIDYLSSLSKKDREKCIDNIKCEFCLYCGYKYLNLKDYCSCLMANENK